MEKDVDDSDIAVVSVTPEETGEYKIEISAYKFKDGYSAGHYGLIVSHNFQ